MKKNILFKKGFAIALTASLLSTVAFDYASAEGNLEKKDPTELVQKQETMKMFSDFQLYLKQGNQEKKVMEFEVENDHEMYLALGEIYREAPSQVKIKSTKLTSQMLQSIYRKTKDSYKDPNETPYIHALLNYKEKKSKNAIILEDGSTPYYDENRELQNLLKGFEISTDFLAKELKGETFEESMLNVSNFIYENFKYNANGLNFMTISNMPKQEMACQGIAFLSKTVFEKMGYKSEIRLGHSHYWITVEKNGNPVTFDPTTDIVLKEKHKTLGLSTKEHIESTSSIGFYSAEYEYNKYKDVPSHNFKSKEETKSISSNSSPFKDLVQNEESIKENESTVPEKQQSQPEEHSFKDIEKHHAKNAITSLFELGYLNHFNEIEFKPNKPITRGEFSQILAYSINMNEDNISSETLFEDLVNHQSMKSVEYLKSRGILTGKTKNTFEPESNLTRQQAAAILSRTMDEIGVDTGNSKYTPYKDNKKISDYAKKDVEKMTKSGIFRGDENGNFNPKSTLTRGQAASVIWSLIKD